MMISSIWDLEEQLIEKDIEEEEVIRVLRENSL